MSLEEEEILSVMADWRNALESRDLERMLQHYHPDVVLYDCKLPHKLTGVDEIRNCWEKCLPYFPEKFMAEHAEYEIRVGGSVAFMHGLFRFIALVDQEKYADGFHWLRTSVCFQKVEGKWLVIHEHFSMPFDINTGMMALIDKAS